MDYLIEEQFRDDLLRDEKILWVGQPETSLFFTGADIFLVPFSLLWGGFAIFWELSVLSEFFHTHEGKSAMPIIFPLFGIPFVIIGFYFIFGRFIYKNWKKHKTYYAVTNKRVLVLTKLFSRSLNAVNIDTIPTINKTVRSNNIGTIKFGNVNWMISMYSNTGMDFFGSFGGVDSPTFYDIKDVNKVHEIVNQLRNG
jgi:hypothetical protein